MYLDPLRLDYKLVTESFGGPFAERHLVITLAETSDTITVAVADPWDKDLFEGIVRAKNKTVRPVLAQKAQLIQVIVEFHGFRRSMRAAEVEYATDLPDLGNLEQLYEARGGAEVDSNDQPVVRAVWYLLNYAFDQRASDIHVEPKRGETRVRMRIDGVLHRMDIAERRRPQDGRFKATFRDKEVEFRVSTVPTAFGEKACIRVFDPEILMQSLDELGFFPRELAILKRSLASNAGMLLVVGPTGTTTLYSGLHHIYSPTVNIVTLEDPIEMVHEHFNQIAMQPKIGLTFGTALKTVLRQDPDVVMVGEIRDEETADNAVQAALTGHMVLSTLHTAEAASSIGRLLDLKIVPYLLSSVLVAVVAQRLVRKVCEHCAVEELLSEEQAVALRIPGARGRQLKVRRGQGCPRCRHTGYKGRTGLFEVMPLTTRIATLIHERAPTQEIKREALNDGMLTLREYGIKKLARGLTTFEEVMGATDENLAY